MDDNRLPMHKETPVHRVHGDVNEKDTDSIPAVGGQVRAISADTCSRVNALINPKWSSIRLFFKCQEINEYCRVINIRPSPNPGFLIVYCSTVFHGDILLEVGGGCSFDLRFQVR